MDACQPATPDGGANSPQDLAERIEAAVSGLADWAAGASDAAVREAVEPFCRQLTDVAGELRSLALLFDGLSVEALLQRPTIDQTQLFSDNSVLRGQEPRVDEKVPN